MSGRISSWARSENAANALPRGAQSHLYVWQTTRSASRPVVGSQPVAWVTSTSTRAPVARAAAETAAASASSPVLEDTSAKATIQVSGPTAPASSASGTCRTRRSPRARNGRTTEAKSPSTHTTSAPGGAAAAASPMNTEACEPTATRDGTTPSKVAAYPRARSTSAVYSITSTVPVAYVSTSRRSAATVTSAGSPSVAAPRYPRPAANRSLTSSPMPPSSRPPARPRDSP